MNIKKGNWKEEAVTKLKFTNRIFNYILVVYSIFITAIFGIDTSPSFSVLKKNYIIQTFIDNIYSILSPGLTVITFFTIFSFIILLAQRRLEKDGSQLPCIVSLLKVSHEAISAEANFLRQGFRITIYKNIKNEELKAFASTREIPITEKQFQICSHDERKNKEIPSKCWFKNLDLKTDRSQRHRVYRLSGKEKNEKSIIAYPLILSVVDDAPWGVLCIRTNQNLDIPSYEALSDKLLTKDGLIAALESLLERQSRSGHFINLVN